MSNLHDKVKYDAGFRSEWAKRCGIGFGLFPLVVPNVPKTEPVRGSAKAVQLIDLLGLIRGLKWSGREDLNLRPPGPEPGALPG